jgi:Tol biopolymer transport system component
MTVCSLHYSQPLIPFIILLSIIGCSKDDPEPTKTNEGSKICFQEIGGASFENRLMIMNYDGTELQELLANESEADFNVRYGGPSFTPDRTKIIFASNRDKQDLNDNDLYLMNLDGSDIVQLTDDPASQEHEPDVHGHTIIYNAYDESGNLQIYSMNDDGSNFQQLTSSSGGPHTPRFSSDGSKIVFSSLVEGDIFIMNADGSGLKNLTADVAGGHFGPALSPDGTRIAYYRNATVNAEIFTMAIDGSDKTQITNFSGLYLSRVISGDPVWSPDGKKIAFTSNKDKTDDFINDVYLMDADGSNVFRLTNSDTKKVFPDWQ